MRDDIGSDEKGLRQKNYGSDIVHLQGRGGQGAQQGGGGGEGLRDSRQGEFPRWKARRGRSCEISSYFPFEYKNGDNENLKMNNHCNNSTDNDDVDDLASGGERWERCKE